MNQITDIHKNYDAVFKEAFTLYQDKTLDFLGLDLAEIAVPLNAESTEIEVKKSYADLLFKLKDNTGMNMEWEADISNDDLLRFLAYNIHATRTYKMPFITVIFTNKEPAVKVYNNLSVYFKPTIINLGERDGDALLAEIKDKLAKGEPVNELALIYLPLYNSSRKTVAELFEEVIELAPRVTDNQQECQKIILLTALLTNKFIPESEYRRLWEAIKMIAEELKIIKFAREDGIEEGRVKGRVEGREVGKFEKSREIALNLLHKGVSIDIIEETTGLTEEEIRDLQQ